MKNYLLIGCLSLQLMITASIPNSPIQTLLIGEANAEQATAPPVEAIAWVLGTKLGIAAVAREAGADPQAIDNMLQSADLLAEALGTTVPEMPQAPDQQTTEFTAEILGYLLNDIEPIAQHLLQQQDRRSADLFEIAIKSSLLAIVYAPGDDMGRTIADVIEARAKRAELADDLWQPLVQAIRSDASYEQVKTGLFEMHGAVRVALMTPSE